MKLSKNKKIKAFALIFVLTVFVSLLQMSASAEAALNPILVNTLYETDDVVIADIVISDAPYNADSTGVLDCTAIIQQALNDCAAAGGGTVFMPAGKYRLTGSVKIPGFVTLRGDWQDPDEANDYGTIILADVPSTNEINPALFTIGGSAGAMGLTVYYPNQDINNVKPYPFTFYVNGIHSDFMLQSIVNCTVINGYRGIGVCVEANQGHEMFTVENFKGTFLSCGAEVYNQSDVGTWKNVYISNDYWVNAGAGLAAANESALKAYTMANATGLKLGDLEWTEFFNLNIEDCNIGMNIVKGKRIEFAGSIFGVNIKDCNIGLQVDSIDERWGMAVSKGSIDGLSKAVVNNTKGYIKLTDVKLSGGTSGKYIENNTQSLEGIEVNANSKTPKPAPFLYVVEADKTRSSDISAVLQTELDKAAITGGVVYLPAGKYLLSQAISVPAGVELRGASSVANREQPASSLGTLIYANYGAGQNADTATALITLAGEAAGVRGLRFVYHENNFINGITPYAYTIRGTSKNVYAVNIGMTGSYNGIDFRACDNHYIKKVIGAWYSNAFSVGGKNGLIEGCLHNGNALYRHNFDIQGWSTDESTLFDLFMNPISRLSVEMIRISNAESQKIVNTFAYGVRNYAVADSSVNTQLVNVGADNIGSNSPMLKISGGSLSAVNVMRYNGIAYEASNAELSMYNRLTINVSGEKNFIGEETFTLWERIVAFFTELFDKIKEFFNNLF